MSEGTADAEGARGVGEGKGGEPGAKTRPEAGHGKARLKGPDRSSEKGLSADFQRAGLYVL